jgi:hypothetical protein
MVFLRSENEGFTSAELSGVGEEPPAAEALAVVPLGQGRERGRLREGHDRLERQRGPVGDMADSGGCATKKRLALGSGPAGMAILFALLRIGTDCGVGAYFFRFAVQAVSRGWLLTSVSTHPLMPSSVTTP